VQSSPDERYLASAPSAKTSVIQDEARSIILNVINPSDILMAIEKVTSRL